MLQLIIKKFEGDIFIINIALIEINLNFIFHRANNFGCIFKISMKIIY